jgi:nucleoid-associated protein YgaU
MPRTTKKTVKKTKVTRREQAEQRADTIKAKIASMNLSRSYTSLAYGVITVLVIFALIFAAVRVFTQDNTPNISEDAVSTMSEENNQTNVHVVKEGETLWSISEEVYNDGFAWKEIADANNISEASTLEEGTELIIPAREAQAQEISMTDGEDAVAEPTMSQMQEQPEVSPSTSQESITGSTYTVKAGDTLWDISMRTYGTGYRWTEIASSNSISDPNIIFTGTNLQLPAK